MKTQKKWGKLALVLIPIGILSWITYTSYIKGLESSKTPPVPNNFVNEIKQEIGFLKKIPVTRFCDSTYLKIKRDITEYSKEKKIDRVWKNLLYAKLDSTYERVFVKQAFYIFNGTEWQREYIQIIEREVAKLLPSIYISKKDSLKEINNILNQYKEITQFITQVNSLSFKITDNNQNDLLNQSKILIKKASNYADLKGYISGCTRIQTQLNGIQNTLYNKHLTFLTQRTQSVIGKYANMASYSEYHDGILKPVLGNFQFFIDSISVYNIDPDIGSKALTNLRELIKQDNLKAKSKFDIKF